MGAAGAIAQFAVLAVIGALLFGPQTILAGASAQEVGGLRATATAAGLLNTMASIGGAFQEVVMRGVMRRWGWGTGRDDGG